MRPSHIPKPRQLNQDLINKLVSEGEAIEDMQRTKGWEIVNEDLQNLKSLLTNIRAINDEATLFCNKQALDIIDQWEKKENARVQQANRYKEQKLYKK